MQLSERMRMIADMVPEGVILADIGTDHGYIPVALVSEGHIPSAIAMDLRSGPLSRAEAHVREHGLEDCIELRLSDGFERLKAGEAGCAVLAGMGGLLILRLLKKGADLLPSLDTLILQPQSDIDQVRAYLHSHRFRIVTERMTLDEGKYYTAMAVCHGEDVPYTREDDLYGRCLIESGDQTLRDYLQSEIRHYQAILDHLGSQVTDRTAARYKEILEELSLANKALDRVTSHMEAANDE